jgi:hypothetical protein
MTFTPNYDGIGELLRSAEMEVMLLSVMEEKKAIAEAIAPVYTGDYKRSFVVVPGFKFDRACAVLRNLMPYAMDPEFGAKGTPRHRTLGRALGVAEA